MVKTSNKKEFEEKKIAFYSAIINAWLTTKLEQDKHLLSLSAGAIGLLVTLLTTVGVNSIFEALVYFASILSFLICVISVVVILGHNAKHLKRMLLEKESTDSVLILLDKVATSTFILGIVLTLIIGTTAIVDNLSNAKENKMSTENEPTRVQEDTVTVHESWSGVSDFQPEAPQGSSSGQNQNPSNSQSSSPDTTGTQDKQ